jgi:hypothetical protein
MLSYDLGHLISSRLDSELDLGLRLVRLDFSRILAGNSVDLDSGILLLNRFGLR